MLPLAHERYVPRVIHEKPAVPVPLIVTPEAMDRSLIDKFKKEDPATLDHYLRYKSLFMRYFKLRLSIARGEAYSSEKLNKFNNRLVTAEQKYLERHPELNRDHPDNIFARSTPVFKAISASLPPKRTAPLRKH